MTSIKNQRIYSNDQKYLEQLQYDQENYIGQDTTITQGLLIIHVRPKPKPSRKKKKYNYDDDEDYKDIYA